MWLHPPPAPHKWPSPLPPLFFLTLTHAPLSPRQHHSLRVAMETAERHASRVRDGEKKGEKRGKHKRLGCHQSLTRTPLPPSLMPSPPLQTQRPTRSLPRPPFHLPLRLSPSFTRSPSLLLSRQAARVAGMETFTDGSTGNFSTPIKQTKQEHYSDGVGSIQHIFLSPPLSLSFHLLKSHPCSVQSDQKEKYLSLTFLLAEKGVRT